MNKTTFTIGGIRCTFDETQSVLFGPDGTPVTSDVRKIGEGEYSALIGNESLHFFLVHSADGPSAVVRNRVYPVDRETTKDRLRKELQNSAVHTTHAVTVKAPMPGLVTKILKPTGSSVQHGEGILIVEAMKMENEIRAPRDGVIKSFGVQEGDNILANHQLFEIE